MSSVGLNLPKLLPIAGTWAAPFALYGLVLSGRITALRVQTQKFIGNKSTTTATKTGEIDPLETAVRCQANFLENVPLAFMFLTIAELNGGDRAYLNYAMATLFALRIAHAEAGLMLKGKFGDNGVGRPLGYFGSCGVLAGLSGYAAWLVKGYWGF